MEIRRPEHPLVYMKCVKPTAVNMAANVASAIPRLHRS